MPRELRIEVLKFDLNLFVAPRLARLSLQRTNLALHFPNEIGDAQKILLGRLQFAQRFFFLRLELRDTGGFFENQPTILGLRRENGRDVALGHDRVTRLAHARAHEKLLHVLEAAWRAIDEILTATVAKDAPRDGHFIVFHLDARSAKLFVVHVADGEGYFRHTEGFAPVRAVEDNVGHFPAAQGFG